MKPKGSTFTVVEKAGYEGERDVRSFQSLVQADSWLSSHYLPSEIEILHVLIAMDTPDRGRTYEY